MSRRDERLEFVKSKLPGIWSDVLGIRIEEVETEFEANVLEWIDRSGGDLGGSIEYVSFIIHLESMFDLQATNDDFQELFDFSLQPRKHWWSADTFASTLTNRQLSEWIVDHMPEFRFAPVNIAGADCAPAGVFFGMRDLLLRDHSAAEIAPSTRIHSVLNGPKLLDYWDHLAAHTMKSLPLIDRPYHWFASAITLSGILIAAIGVILFFGTLHLPVLAYFTIPGVVIARLGGRLDRACQLPTGIETFGDLARYIAAS